MSRQRTQTLIAGASLLAAAALGAWGAVDLVRYESGWREAQQRALRLRRMERVEMSIIRLLAAEHDGGIEDDRAALAAAVSYTGELIERWEPYAIAPVPESLSRFGALDPAVVSIPSEVEELAVDALRDLQERSEGQDREILALLEEQAGVWRQGQALSLLIAALTVGVGGSFVALALAERRTQQTRRRLEEVTSNLPAAVYRAVLSPKKPLRYAYMSEGIEGMLGLSAKDVVRDAEAAMSRIVPEDRPRFEAALRRALEGGPVEDTEIRFTDTSGRVRWIRRSACATRLSGGDVALDGVLIDVTALKQAQDELVASESRYRALVDSSPDGILVHQDMKVVYANERCAALFGAPSADALVGTPVMNLVHPDLRPTVGARIARLYSAEGSSPPLQERLIRLDDQIFHAEVQGAPCTHEGRPAAQVIIRDVSERLRQEDRLRLLNRELQHRVKNNLAAVQSVADQTARHSQTVQEFRDKLLQRVQAMSRMNELMRRIGESAIGLRPLFERTLEAYLDIDDAVTLDGDDDVVVTARAAEVLNHVVNELAVNAAKHGALARPNGSVRLQWTQDDQGEVHIHWHERGGPRLATFPPSRGFGAQVIEGSVPYELGGAVTWNVRNGELICEITLPRSAIAPVDDGVGSSTS